MLAEAYCYLSSSYAELTLHILQLANNVGWRKTTSFIISSDVILFDYHFLSSSVLFNCFWHLALLQNA